MEDDYDDDDEPAFNLCTMYDESPENDLYRVIWKLLTQTRRLVTKHFIVLNTPKKRFPNFLGSRRP